MESKVVKSDFSKLDNFMKALHSNYVVRVGIMGAKNARSDSNGQSNADIGFIHEYGRPQTGGRPAIPERSFLRMPILVKAQRIIQETIAAGSSKHLAKGDMKAVMVDLGIACERAILDAFESAGFGSWARNTAYTLAHKKGDSPLIDLGFLRKSITSEVVKIS
jgi:hypothetical protein